MINIPFRNGKQKSNYLLDGIFFSLKPNFVFLLWVTDGRKDFQFNTQISDLTFT